MFAINYKQTYGLNFHNTRVNINYYGDYELKCKDYKIQISIIIVLRNYNKKMIKKHMGRLNKKLIYYFAILI